ncbi:unnamed protein product, partial [Laminaria digitata]
SPLFPKEVATAAQQQQQQKPQQQQQHNSNKQQQQHQQQQRQMALLTLTVGRSGLTNTMNTFGSSSRWLSPLLGAE